MIDDRDIHSLCVTDWISEQCFGSRLIQVLTGRPLHRSRRGMSQAKNTRPRSGVPGLVYPIRQSQSKQNGAIKAECFSKVFVRQINYLNIVDDGTLNEIFDALGVIGCRAQIMKAISHC